MFVLTATIVRQAAWPDFDRKWRAWKQRNLGSADIVVHEPDVRHGNWPFGGPKGEEVVEELRRVIAELEFTALVCIVRRDAYASSYGAEPLDESLPSHLYLMSLDLITERPALALDGYFNGGRARVIAESRRPKEDAMLQYEFARLQLHGTSYISSGWFRQQLHPGITFESKGGEFSSGLQMADLLGRPSAEKVLNPESDPPGWAESREKLFPGRETKNSIIGLKIVPRDDSFADMWRAPEKAEI